MWRHTGIWGGHVFLFSYFTPFFGLAGTDTFHLLESIVFSNLFSLFIPKINPRKPILTSTGGNMCSPSHVCSR